MNKDILYYTRYQDEILIKLFKEGNVEIIKWFMRTKEKHSRSTCFIGACTRGNIELVKLMMGIKGEYKQENIDIFDMIPDNKLRLTDSEWDNGFKNACYGGHMDIINLMIGHGVSWYYGFEGACEGGHMDIIELMISKGENSWNTGLYYACKGGHMDIIKLLIDKGANSWNNGLDGACVGGHMNIVKFMISKGAHDLHSGFRLAEYAGHIDILSFLSTTAGVNMSIGKYYPHRNTKAKYFNLGDKSEFLSRRYTVLYWVIIYEIYCKKDIVQRDLVPELFNILYLRYNTAIKHQLS